MKIISTLQVDYLISQKYKKCSPGKYPMLLCVAVSIRWISIRFDAIYIFLCTLYFKQYLVFILAIYLIIIKIGSTTICFSSIF